MRLFWHIKDDFIHAMDAGFLTVSRGEVYTQIAAITRQIPVREEETRPASSVPLPEGTMRPGIRVEKSAPRSASVGIPLTYTITLQNDGESTAHEVVVEDRIPESLEIVGSYPVAHRKGNILSWRFVTLPKPTG